MRVAVALLTLFFAVPAFGADAPAKSSGLSPAREQKIRELLKETGADQVGEAMLSQLKAQLPPDQYERLASVIHPSDLVDLLVPIYAKHFDEAEVDGLLTFYRSSVGKKLVAEMPAIGSESAVVGQSYAREQVMKLRATAPPPNPSRSDVPPAHP